MSRKGENIYKRKDKRWEGRILIGYSPEGKRRYHSVYGKSYKEVKEKRQEYLQTHLPVEVVSAKNYAGTMKFGICIDMWLQQQKSKIKESTYSTYIRMLESQILPELREVYLQDLTPQFLVDFFKRKEEHGRCDGKGGLATKTLSDLAILLNSIFEYISKEYNYSNPMNDIKYKLPQKINQEPLTQSECQVLTQHLLADWKSENAGILISLYMGLRLGEVCALRWENIDLERQVIKIRHTLYRVLNENSNISSAKTVLSLSAPKTAKSIRDIPIPVFILPFLEILQTNPENYLLTGTSNYMDPRTYQNYFKKSLTKCTLRNIPYHCLRHTFATNCVILGFDVKTLSEILGHANTKITLERYVHSSFYQKQLQMMKISDSISSIL